MCIFYKNLIFENPGFGLIGKCQGPSLIPIQHYRFNNRFVNHDFDAHNNLDYSSTRLLISVVYTESDNKGAWSLCLYVSMSQP